MGSTSDEPRGFAGKGVTTDEQDEARTKVTLQVVSDLICPFAYIGHLKVAKAIEAAQKASLPIDVVVHHLPFQLDPSLSEDQPISRQERHARSLGDEDYQLFVDRVNRQGSGVGWRFKTGGQVRQTTDFHRLLMLAYKRGGAKMQYPLMASLYSGFWDDLRDPGDADFLSAEAVKVGLFPDQAAAREWLASDALWQQVKTACQQIRSRGVKGVPFTVVNGKYAICGAQDPDELVQMFRRIANGELPSHLIKDGSPPRPPPPGAGPGSGAGGSTQSTSTRTPPFPARRTGLDTSPPTGVATGGGGNIPLQAHVLV